jgi:hypothetical protein
MYRRNGLRQALSPDKTSRCATVDASVLEHQDPANGSPSFDRQRAPGDLYFGSAKTKDIARTYVSFRHAISGQIFPKQAGAEALPGLRGISLTPEIVMFPGIMHERAIGILKMFPDAVLGFQSMRIEIHAAA